MENILGKKYWLFLIVSLLLVGGFYLINPEPVKAGSEHNLSGWAYSSNIGWVSFNALNCALPASCDATSCVSAGQDPLYGGHPGCPPQGMANYGVKINPDGKLSGRAWSSVGWITFNRDEAGIPPKDDPCPDESCIAEIEGGSPPSSCGSGCLITGWARACGTPWGGSFQCGGSGWDSWIRLNGQITSGGSYEVTLNTSDNEFHGYAWGGDPEGIAGDSVIGWISFNHRNCDPDVDGFSNGIGACPPADNLVSDYKVVYNPSNENPSAAGLELEYNSYGCFEDGAVGFKWTYTDYNSDQQYRFDFRVNDVNNVNDSNPEIDRRYCNLDSQTPASPRFNTQSAEVVKSSTINSHTYCQGTSDEYIVSTPDKLSYGKNYYWWVRVWDSNGGNSGWVQYNGSVPTRSYPKPEPSFSVSNIEPEVEEEVIFTDNSTCWGASCNYAWDVNGDETVDYTTEGTIVHSYNTEDEGKTYTPTLEITDGLGGTCPFSGQSVAIGGGLPKPEWKEIPPTSRLLNGVKNVFANISNFFNKIFSI